MELVLEQTQQGSSHEVSISTKGVEELKRIIRRWRYNIIPAELKFKTPCSIIKDKYRMKAQVHVSKSSAIFDVQALPQRKHYYQNDKSIKCDLSSCAGSELGSELTSLAGSELSLTSYRLIEDYFPATCEQELCLFNFLLASCQVSSSELSLASYRLINDYLPTTCERELSPLILLLASCQLSPSKLLGNEQCSERLKGKENGVNILKSIDEGPFQMGTLRETLTKGTEGALDLGPEQPRVYSDLTSEEKDRYNANIWATNILLQGLPKDIYSLINHYTDAKDIWDNVKMLMKRLELVKEDRKSQLYDDFKQFEQLKEETIHDYYVRFAKLINDMWNIKMTTSKMQLNLKFVNNMLP
nr:putative zinc finger, CCHC-type [Tanacetum cinerariifolium]